MFFRKRRDADLARARAEAQLQAQMADMAVAQLAEMRRQYENRIADLKEAHERAFAETQRTIKALADEVEYLRVQHFGASTGVAAPRVAALPEPDFMPKPTQNPHLYMSEEEEDLRAMHDAGLVDDVEFKRILDALHGVVGPITTDPNFS